MKVKEIIKLPEHKIKKHIHKLADFYLKNMNRKICLSCGGDIAFMIYDIKKYFNMTKFKLKKEFAIYKVFKNKGLTISNANMTDELAILFIKQRTKRIELFSEFPENWETLISASGCNDCKEDEECDKCKKKKELMKMKVNELKKMHPEIEYSPLKGMKKIDFINEILKNY